MNWIDAHCHLSDARIGPELGQLLHDCAAAGIQRFVLGGVDPGEWQRQIELDKQYPGRFLKVFGLHPWRVHEMEKTHIELALKDLEPLLAQCLALGETGLDGARDRFKQSGDRQLHAFEAQLALAAKHHKPLVLHIVRAHPQALETLKRHAPQHGGLIHSFSGTWADAQKYLDLGFTLSISARVTYPNAHDLHETVTKAPPDRLVFETDSPDQPPYGATDKLHTPLSLLRVVHKISELRGEQSETWLDRSRDNLQRIFKI